MIANAPSGLNARFRHIAGSVRDVVADSETRGGVIVTRRVGRKDDRLFTLRIVVHFRRLALGRDSTNGPGSPGGGRGAILRELGARGLRSRGAFPGSARDPPRGTAFKDDRRVVTTHGLLPDNAVGDVGPATRGPFRPSTNAAHRRNRLPQVAA